MRFLQWGYEVVLVQFQGRVIGTLVQNVFRDGAVCDISLRVDGEDACLVQSFQKITHAQNDDLMRHDQHASPSVMQTDGVEHAPQPKDDVAPAFSRRRPEVKFSDQLPRGRQFGMPLFDAELRQPIEDPEFLLAQAFVDHQLLELRCQPSLGADQVRRTPRALVGRTQDDLRPLDGRERCKPAS